LVIKDGSFYVNNFSLGFSDILLGAFTLKTVKVGYKISQNSDGGTDTTYLVTLQVKFPQNWEVGGTIIIVNNEIDTVSINWRSDSEAARIAIGTTGLFLTEMYATVAN